MPAFISQALRGEAAHRLRRRLADAQLLLRRRPGRGHLPAAAVATTNDPVNIGNPHEMTILRVRRDDHRADRLDEPHRLQAAADRRSQGPPARHHARRGRMLGWEPQVPLEEGLAKTIDYFRQQAERLTARPRAALQLGPLSPPSLGACEPRSAARRPRVRASDSAGADVDQQRSADRWQLVDSVTTPSRMNVAVADLAEDRRRERARPDRQVDDGDGDDDADVAAEHEHREPERDALHQVRQRQRQHHEHRHHQQLVGRRIEPGAERGLLTGTPGEQPVERIGERRRRRRRRAPSPNDRR